MNISRLLVFFPLVLCGAAQAADLTPAKSPIVSLGPISSAKNSPLEAMAKGGTYGPAYDRTCYAIRSYRFSHPAGSDAPKMEGSSTCQKANLFAKKDAVGPPARLSLLTSASEDR